MACATAPVRNIVLLIANAALTAFVWTTMNASQPRSDSDLLRVTSSHSERHPASQGSAFPDPKALVTQSAHSAWTSRSGSELVRWSTCPSEAGRNPAGCMTLRRAISELQAVASNRTALNEPIDFVADFWGVQDVQGMPARDQCLLSRATRSPGNVVLVSVSNMGHFELVVNWALGVLKQNVDRFVVLSVDKALVAALAELNIPAIQMQKSWLTPPGTQQFDELTSVLSNPNSGGAAGYGAGLYTQLTKLKLLSVLSLLRSGRSVHLNDDDIGWADDASNALLHFEALADMENATLVAISDVKDSTKGPINTGQYLASPRAAVMRILRAGLEKSALHDQVGIIEKSGHLMNLQPPYNGAGDGRVVDTWLRNDETYAIGYYACNKRKMRKDHPSSVHANYVTGAPAKIACLKKNNVWHLPGAITGQVKESIAKQFAALPVHAECGS